MLLFKFNPTLLILIYSCQAAFDEVIKKFGYNRAYAFRCVQCEYSMRFSENFLLKAAENAENHRDEFWLQYFNKHFHEEKGHHDWAVGDLNLVQKQIGSLPRTSNEVVELMEFQSKKLSDGEFLPQFGYCLAVECFQGSKKYWENFLKHCDYPRRAFTNCLNHSVIDVGHRDEIIDIYSGLSEQKKILVDQSAIHSAHLQLLGVRQFLNSNLIT